MRMLVWLLQRQLVEQVHEYVYLLKPFRLPLPTSNQALQPPPLLLQLDGNVNCDGLKDDDSGAGDFTDSDDVYEDDDDDCSEEEGSEMAEEEGAGKEMVAGQMTESERAELQRLVALGATFRSVAEAVSLVSGKNLKEIRLSIMDGHFGVGFDAFVLFGLTVSAMDNWMDGGMPIG